MSYESGSPEIRPIPAEIRNFTWLTLDRVARTATALVLGVWMARALSPDSFGKLSSTLAFILLLSAIPGLGLESLLRRDLVRTPDRAQKLLGTVFLLRLIAGFSTFLGLALAVRWLPAGSAPNEVALVLGALLLQPSVQTLDAWFHARLDARAVVLAQNFALIAAGVARTVVLLNGADLFWIAVTMAIEAPLAAVVIIASYRRRGEKLTAWTFDPEIALALYREAWPLLATSLAIMIYHKIDHVLLASLAGNEEAGRYAAATRMVELWHFMPMGIAASLAPGLVTAHARGHSAFLEAGMRLMRKTSAVAWTATLAIAITAPWLLPLMLGEPYRPAGAVASILAFSLPFIALGVARAELWLVAGRGALGLRAALAGAAINLGLNMLFIPRWGATGAAWANLLTSATAGLAIGFCWPETRPMALMQWRALLRCGLVRDERAR